MKGRSNNKSHLILSPAIVSLFFCQVLKSMVLLTYTFILRGSLTESRNSTETESPFDQNKHYGGYLNFNGS